MTATATTRNAATSASTAASLVIEPLSAQSRRSRRAKARARRVTAKEAKAAKVAKDSEDLATRAVGFTWPGSAPQQAKAVKGFLCRQLGVHGDRLRTQDRRRSSGDSGRLEKAQTRARATARENLA